MAVAARSPSAPDGEYQASVVTIEMKTSFLRPGTGRLVARGARTHRTSQLAFCEAHVYDGEGRLDDLGGKRATDQRLHRLDRNRSVHPLCPAVYRHEDLVVTAARRVDHHVSTADGDPRVDEFEVVPERHHRQGPLGLDVSDHVGGVGAEHSDRPRLHDP